MRDDDQFQRRVAVKIAHARPAPELLSRFRSERRILAALDHPNMARLLDGGTTEDGVPYLVLEYVEGEPIDRYCDAQQLPVQERLQIFRAVCAAVQYAHQNLVVHRDLKPANVLVTPDGTPKLLDFGIAKLLKPELLGQAPLLTTALHRADDPGVREPGAGARRAGHDRQRRVLAGRPPLRAAHGVPAAASRGPGPDGARAHRERGRAGAAERGRALAGRAGATGEPPRSAAATRGTSPGEAATDARGRPRQHPAHGPSQGAGPPLRLGRAARGRPAAARSKACRCAPARTPSATGPGNSSGATGTGWATAAAFFALVVGFGINRAQLARELAEERDQAQQEAATAQPCRASSSRTSSASPTRTSRTAAVTGREILDRAAERLGAPGPERPEVRAALLDTIGNVYRQRGLYSRAEPLLQQALEERRAALGEDHLDTARSLLHMGELRRRARPAEGGELLRGALGALESSSARSTRPWRKRWRRWGSRCRDQRKSAEAESALRRAIASNRPFWRTGYRSPSGWIGWPSSSRIRGS